MSAGFLATGLIFAPAPASAQPEGEQTSPREPVQAMTESAADSINAAIPHIFYESWRGKQLIGQSVSSFQDEGLGKVEDILINDGGRIEALVVLGGGFLGIGESAFPIAWPLVSLTPGDPGVVAPFTKQEAKQQGLLSGPEEITPEPGTYRLSEIIGREVQVEDAPGRIDDILFNPDGQAVAVVVSRPAEQLELSSPAEEDTALAAYTDANSGRRTLILAADAVEITQGSR